MSSPPLQKQNHHSLASVSKILFVTLCVGFIKCIAATPSEKLYDPWPTMDSPPLHSNLHLTSGKNVEEAPRLGQREGSHRSRGGMSSSAHANEFCTTSCRCNFFLWDFVSFFKYRETTFSAKQNTFEGKGGRKFVRIQPNTVLEKWYPQLRAGKLKPNACLLCGHSWEEHLEFWWYCRRKQGGVSSAFERCIEKSTADQDDKFAYHKNYVDEITISNSRNCRRGGRDVRESFDGSTSYLVPPFNPLVGNGGRPKSIGSVLLLALARTVSLMKIEELMWLSNVESSRSRLEL
mmetsp:Transcript_25204/g.45437  ORF Transcript_25204/g.45437 Transcript_25204/m.45437 type:complete len:291 (+) Transcript_25204:221-1093(+)